MIELIAAMIIWGTLGVFVLWSGVSVIDVAFYRCLFGVILMSFWVFNAKEKIHLNKKTGMVVLAGIFLVLNWIFLFKSFQVSSITIGNVSYYLQPIFLIILGVFFYQEKVSYRQWLYMLIAFMGVMLTLDLRQLGSTHVLLGGIFALIAALFYSFFTLFMKNNTTFYLNAIFIQLIIGVLILLPFVHFQHISSNAYICLIIIGVVHTVFAYLLYFKAIKKTSFSQIATMSYLDPIVAIATDVLFFNRKLNGMQITGIGLTFLALHLLVSRRKCLSADSRLGLTN